MGLLFLLATLAWVWAKLLSFEFLTSGCASALHILSQPLPISASVRRRAGAPDLLCRHAVLHGEDTNYDRQIKSCERYPPERCLLGFLIIYECFCCDRGFSVMVILDAVGRLLSQSG